MKRALLKKTVSIIEIFIKALLVRSNWLNVQLDLYLCFFEGGSLKEGFWSELRPFSNSNLISLLINIKLLFEESVWAAFICLHSFLEESWSTLLDSPWDLACFSERLFFFCVYILIVESYSEESLFLHQILFYSVRKTPEIIFSSFRKETKR